MNKKIRTQLLAFFVTVYLFVAPSAYAVGEVINLEASSLVARSEISITPAQATFTEGSIFEVPILINTKGRSINTIELNLKFDPQKLSIVKPSTGKSIIGLWIQPPTYDNTKGVASIAGSIPGGIVSDSSLILSITFQAKNVGTTEVRVQDTSSVLANDGVGTPTVLTYNRGVYTILPKPPGGLTIYSDTHPFQDHWYNNNSPVLAWNKDPGIIGFSYILDDKPNTIPDNKNLVNEPTKAYQDLGDGLWYFHVKALKDSGAWSATTNYLLRIDTTAPAKFIPKADYILNKEQNRALVSFFTTDSLSGIDHYEIGVIDKSQSQTSSPIFVRSESPFQVPPISVAGSTVIVRAYDIAGNSLDTQLDISAPSKAKNYFTDNAIIILGGIILLLILLYFIHYMWGHRVIKKLKMISHLLNGRKEDNKEKAIAEVEEKIEVEEKVTVPTVATPTQVTPASKAQPAPVVDPVIPPVIISTPVIPPTLTVAPVIPPAISVAPVNPPVVPVVLPTPIYSAPAQVVAEPVAPTVVTPVPVSEPTLSTPIDPNKIMADYLKRLMQNEQ